ncbi:MAG: acyl-CoA dehydrogenase family protein [Sulfuricaulis sp.]|nr:acyl-CoA dehydrogenase family protein [Sulfuricaulis sp.]
MTTLTPTQQKYKDMARKLANEQLSKDAARIDKEAAFPVAGLRAMAELGLCGMTVPKEYGGLDLDALSICLVTEELARGCPSTAAVLMAYVIGIQPLVQFGTPAQKKAYLPDLAQAKRSICFAVTEALTGSDIATIGTTARRKGDGWVLNGTKCLIGNGAGADLCVVAAKTDPDAGHKGVSVFIVETASAGYSVSAVYEKMGMRGTTTAELTLKDVEVPATAVIGEIGKGSRYLLQTLDLARLTLGAEAIGLSQAALEESVAYAKQRVTFGKPISEHQGIQFMLADMATSVHAARTMLHDACRLHGRKEPFAVEASMVKLFASEMAGRVTDAAVQIHGGWGVVDRPKVERLFRDSRYTRIWEGTSEIQRLVISRGVLEQVVK